KVIREHKIEPTEPALLEFFRKRTLSEEDQKRFRALVKALGSEAYVIREQATQKLLKEGIPVLAFLKEAEYDSNVERSRRAQDCMNKVRESNNTAVPIAAAHLLARPPQKKGASHGEIIRTLLAYIPFVDDEIVEEEILTCL